MLPPALPSGAQCDAADDDDCAARVASAPLAGRRAVRMWDRKRMRGGRNNGLKVEGWGKRMVAKEMRRGERQITQVGERERARGHPQPAA